MLHKYVKARAVTRPHAGLAVALSLTIQTDDKYAGSAM